jgi:hypothetical protein
MQSVPITTDVVSSNLDQGEVYNWHYVSDLRQICGFLPGSPVSSINKADRQDFKWNIVESGFKHHHISNNKLFRKW